MFDQAEEVDVLPPEELATDAFDALENWTPERLDSVTLDPTFQDASWRLLTGQITYDKWEVQVSAVLNRRIDLPLVQETTEQKWFQQAVSAFGEVLQGVLSANMPDNGRLRDVTMRLLNGEAVVTEWVEVAVVAIGELVDVPVVPELAEDFLFRKVGELLANALHGLAVEGASAAVES